MYSNFYLKSKGQQCFTFINNNFIKTNTHSYTHFIVHNFTPFHNSIIHTHLTHISKMENLKNV